MRASRGPVMRPEKPYPQADHALPRPGQPDPPCCPAAHVDDWLCTRIEGHKGPHEAAGVDLLVLATWRD